MHTRSTRVARAATAALAAALALTIGAPAQAADPSPSGAVTPLTGVRGRAGLVALAASQGRLPEAPPEEAGTPAPAPSQRPGPVSGAQRQDLSGPTADTAPATGIATAAETVCGSFEFSVTDLGDRALLRVRPPAGTSSLTLWRQRNQGVRTTLATIPATGTEVSYVDDHIDVRGWTDYWVRATSTDGVVLMDCRAAGALYGEGTDHWGVASLALARDNDIQLAGNGGSETLSLVAGQWQTPALSPDGRLLAAALLPTASDPGAVVVRNVARGTVAFSVPPAAGEVLADPAFSPDGQNLAFTRYALDTGLPLGLGFVDVFGSHVHRSLTAQVPVAEPAWRPDGTLVATAFDAQGGLALLCSTCTTTEPIAGTAGGYSPEVAADGSIWFATTGWNPDGTFLSELKVHSSSGAVSTVRQDSAYVISSPRLSPQGQLWFQKDQLGPTGDPVDSRIIRVDDAASPQRDRTLPVFLGAIFGFDVRQPQTKGSSHLAGDRGEDLIARDRYGTLWVYPSANVGFAGSRQRIGGGWQIYTAILSGDLTGDDRTDLLARDTAGALWLYVGRPTGGFVPRIKIGSGWLGYRIVSPGDWDGDGRADIMGADSAGVLWLYPGTGRGTLGARRRVGSGWTSMNAVLGAGDINRDAAMDLIARGTDGTLWLYPGRGDGGFLARRKIGSGWNGFTALAVTEDTGQGAGVYGRTSTGLLDEFITTGDGRFTPSYVQVGSGWNGYTLAN